MPTAQEIRDEAGLTPQPQQPSVAPLPQSQPATQDVAPTKAGASHDAPLPPVDEQPQQTDYAPFYNRSPTYEQVLLQNEYLDAVGGQITADADIGTHAREYQLQKLKPFFDTQVALRNLEQDRERQRLEWMEKNKPSMLDTTVAMLQEENIISAFMAYTPMPSVPPDPNYNPFEDPRLEEYSNYSNLWYLSTSREETTAILSNLRRELRNREIISRSPTWNNLASGLLAGIGSPITLASLVVAPLAVGRFGSQAVSAARTIGYGAAIGASQTAVEEVILHGINDQRTLDETALNLVASVLLDSIVGTIAVGGGKLSAQYQNAKLEVVDYLRKGGDTPVDPMSTVGAMRAEDAPVIDTSDISWKSPLRKTLFHTALKMSKATPLGRLLQAESGAARQLALELIETNINMSTARGTVAVESLLNKEINKTAQVLLDMLKLEKKFKKEYGKTSAEFWSILDATRRRGDVSDYPEIQQAAQIHRERLEELWNRAAEAGVPSTFHTIQEKDPVTGEVVDKRVPITQGTATSYAQRVYNKDRVIMNQREFYDAVERGLQAHRNDINSEVNIKAANYTKENSAKVSEAEATIKNTPQEKKNLKSLIQNKERAVQSNAKDIGRRKQVDPDDPYIKELESRNKEILKDRAKVEKTLKQLEADTKAAKTFLSNYNAKLKDIKSKYIEAYEPDFISNYQDSFYEGITGLRLGDMNNGADPRPSIFKGRQPIRDEYLEDFIENNARDELISITNQLAGRIHLQERYGSIELTEQIENVNSDYSQRIIAAEDRGDIKQATKLRREQKAVVKDLAVVRDRLLFRVNDLSQWPAAQSVGRSVLYFNISTKLAGQLLSSTPEVGKLTAAYGVGKVTKAMAPRLPKVVAGLKKLEPSQAEKLASAAAREGLVKPAQSFDVFDVTPTSRLERGTQMLANITHKLSFQQFFDSTFRGVAGTLWADAFAIAARKGDTAKLLKAGFTEPEIAVIQREIKRAKKSGGLYDPNIESWKFSSPPNGFDYRRFMDKYEALLVKEANTLIVKPSVGDRPIFMDKMTWRIVLQFKSFLIAATNKTMLPITQNGSDFWKHTITMSGISILSYLAYATAKGDDPDLSPESLTREALNRGGYLGYAADIYGNATRLTGALRPPSKYQSRNQLGSLLGPTYGTAEDFVKFINLGRKEDGTMHVGADQRMRAIRKLVPFQNHWLFRQGLDKAEGMAARAFGGTGKYADKRQPKN